MLLPALMVMAFGAGCIKEDRDECPCRLFLDFSDVDTASVTSADIHMTSENGFEFSDEVEKRHFQDYMIMVPSKQVLLHVLSGAGHCLSNDMSVTIPYGEECPKLFGYESLINTDCEQATESIRLRKNHCVLTIQVETDAMYPFNLVVKGNVDGYGSDLKPRAGEFFCKAVPDSSGRSVVVIPRQVDTSLALEVDDGTGIVKTFAVGESIVAGGYDWNAENLDDVTVTLDYSLSKFALDILEWTEEYVHEVVI